MNTLNSLLPSGKSLCCPHCNTDQGEQVQDYVLEGLGEKSACTDSCYSCGLVFRVMRVEVDKYQVSVADASPVC